MLHVWRSLDSTSSIAMEQSLSLESSLDSPFLAAVDNPSLQLFTESQSFIDAVGSNSGIKAEFI